MEKKRIWTMVDIVENINKVDFGRPVTLEEAIDMWCNEEYADIVDEYTGEIIDFQRAY